MQKLNNQKLKQVEIMSKNTEDKEDKGWAIQIGLYTGILFGIRTYEMLDVTCHVFYLPFIDVALVIDK